MLHCLLMRPFRLSVETPNQDSLFKISASKLQICSSGANPFQINSLSWSFSAPTLASDDPTVSGWRVLRLAPAEPVPALLPAQLDHLALTHLTFHAHCSGLESCSGSQERWRGIIFESRGHIVLSSCQLALNRTIFLLSQCFLACNLKLSPLISKLQSRSCPLQSKWSSQAVSG